MKRTILLTLILSMAAWCAPGCQLVGFFAQAFEGALPDKEVPAEFPGLAGHSVAVVVFADVETQYEYPTARLELTGAITAELRKNVKNIRVTDPLRVVRWQDENLDWDSMDKTKIAQVFGTQYVLYVAIAKFSTHEPGSEYLFRGEIIADVILYDGAKEERSAKVWYGSDIHVTHPDTAVPADNDRLVRPIVESTFANFLAKKFYKYKVPREPKKE